MPLNDITGVKWFEMSYIVHHYRRIVVTMAADCRGWPWKLLRLDVRGNCRGNCLGLPRTSMVITALPWQWPRMTVKTARTAAETSAEAAVAIAASFRGLSRLVRQSLPRTEPRHVPWLQPWHLPRGSAMSRGTCHRNPRISTVARGSTPTEVHGSSAVIAADLRQKVE